MLLALLVQSTNTDAYGAQILITSQSKGAGIPCFTSKEVQILTELGQILIISQSKGAGIPALLVQKLLYLLGLLVQKY